MLNRDSILKSIKILLFFFASSVSLSHKISHAGVVTGHAVQCWQADICGLYCTVLLQAQVLSLVVMCSVGKLQAPVVCTVLYCTVLLQAQVLSLVVMCSVGKLAPMEREAQTGMCQMVDIHLRNLLWVYCPGHAGVKGNDRADRLAGKATLTSGLLLGSSEVLRSF